MDAAEEQQEAAAGQPRRMPMEGLDQCRRTSRRGDRAERRDVGSVGVAPEDPARLALLFLAGEQRSLGPGQQLALGHGPEALLQQMLAGVGLAEPRIHHPVGEHVVGHRAARQDLGRGEGRVVPQPVDHGHVEAVEIGFQPGLEQRGCSDSG